MTPIELLESGVYVKREDLHRCGRANGSKTRAIQFMIGNAAGVVTAGGRNSTQMLMTSTIAVHLGIHCEVHCPDGERTEIMDAVEHNGHRLVLHRPGYSSVVNQRAVAAARVRRGWALVPYAMRDIRMVQCTAAAAADCASWPGGRLVIAVGSGMTLCGILTAMERTRTRRPILGVIIGGDPEPNLRRYAPNWRSRVTLTKAKQKYHEHAPMDYCGVPVDPVYSGKCAAFLERGDLLWNSGARQATL